MKKLITLLKIVSILIFIIFVFIQILIISEFKDESDKKVDYIVILGAKIYGVKPSASLSKRIKAATVYLKENKNMKVIATGGQGKKEKISEAEVIKRELVKNGIENNRIIVENNSKNTVENLKYSLDKIHEINGGEIDPDKKIKILIVTNNYHLYRSKKIAENLGFEVYGLPAKTPPKAILYAHVREFLSVIKYYFGI